MSEGAAVAAPKNLDELVALVQQCAATRTPMSTSSGEGTFGEIAAEGQRITLRHLDHVNVDPDSMTLTAGAGAPVAKVQEAAAAKKFEIPGLVAASARHVGSAVARGEIPRRSLCDVQLLLSSGERVGGSRTLRGHGAYDHTGVVLGSMGRLGIIAEAVFRLEPEGSRTPVTEGRGEATLTVGADLADAFDRDRLLRPGSA